MRLGHLLGISLAAVLVAVFGGCSPSTVGYDYDENIDFSRFETYGWLEQVHGLGAVTVPVTQGVFQRAREAADAIMKRKGFNKVGAGPNMGMVIYVGNGRHLDTSPWGYSVGNSPGSVKNENYAQGALIIDIVNNRSKLLIWRGARTSVVGDTGQVTAAIDDAVVTILENFPPQ